MTDSEKERLEGLEREKSCKIGEYLSLQDRADELNERIYQICCGIESLNGQIDFAREQATQGQEKAHPNGSPPAKGKHSPPKA